MNIGEALGSYRLVQRLGAGGMGEVWQAEDTRLRRTVAIKILADHVATSEESQARFIREARTAAQLYHPNIATIHAIEEHNDRSFIVMEYVSGETLTKQIARGAMAEADVSRIATQVASALAEAHRNGIVHRDIKPDNIVIAGDRVKVLDFGIAKIIGPRAAGGGEITGIVTEAGMILGTVFYMSPEQALGKPLDPRTDLFSLGVVMYQALSGRLPFRGQTVTETLTLIIRDAPTPVREVNPSISNAMAAAVARCLQKDRELRYGSAGELIEDLTATGAGRAEKDVVTEPISADRPSPDVTIELSAPSPRTDTAASRIMPERPSAATLPMSPAEPPRSRRTSFFLALAAVFALMLVAALAVTMRPKERKEAGEVPAASEAAAVTQRDASPALALETPPPVIVEQAQPERSPIAEKATEAPSALPPPSASDPERGRKIRAEELYQDGLRFVQSGDRAGALVAFTSAVANDPTHAAARMKLARGAIMTGRLPEAIRQYAMAYEHRERLEEREARLSAIGAAIVEKDLPRARELGSAFGKDYPGDEELAALQRSLKRAENGQPRSRRRP